MSVHCPTCTCSALWEMVSYHIVRVLEVYLGGLGAILTVAWLIQGFRVD